MKSTEILCIALLCIVSCCVALHAEAINTRRRVNCQGTQANIPPGATDLYSLGLINDTVNFDSLAVLMGVADGGIDLGEFLNVLNAVKTTMNDNSISAKDMAKAWNKTWAELGADKFAAAERFSFMSDNVSATSNYLRAASYMQLAVRFGVHFDDAEGDRIYRKSVESFVRGVTQDTPGAFVKCSHVKVPYTNGNAVSGGYLHGYFCPGRGFDNVPVTEKPTIILVDGYDGTAEFMYHQNSFLVNYGFNLIIFDGPGQGLTPRLFPNLTFIPNYEKVTSAVYDYYLQQGLLSTKASVFVMGLSFGGYLAPRSFMYDNRFFGLIANGGVQDFYQTMLCHLPEFLQEMYYNVSESAKLNYIMDNAAKYSFSAAFFLGYGRMGFGAKSFSDLLDTLNPYAFDVNDMAKLTNRNVYVYNPAWDTLTGNQSEIFWANMPAVSPFSKLAQLNPYHGTGMHCAVGSTANALIDIAEWMLNVMRNF